MTYDELAFGKILSNLLYRDSITDIMIWSKEIWVTDINKGHYQLLDAKKDDIDELHLLLKIIPRQLAIRMNKAYNEASPIIDAEIVYEQLGQLRFNIIHESLTHDDLPAIAIRKSLYNLRINEASIISDNYADKDFSFLMQALVDAGCNIMICGETGSGKTELLRYIAKWIRDNEAIITMEDTLEVYLKRLYPKKNVLALKTSRKYDFNALLKASLRQNPDWICVSETRGKEVLQLNDAVSTGHRLLSTLHTDSAQNIPYRMLNMGQLHEADAERVFRQIHHNINIGIHICYLNDTVSKRYINEICEFYLDHLGKPVSHLIYHYDHTSALYHKEKIISPIIKAKLSQKQTDISKIKGIFI